MTSEDAIADEPQPPLPDLAVKPGYQSTEFWLVTGWTVFAAVAVSQGWFTQAQADGAGAFLSANNALILSVLGALWHYLTSRGKLKSNTVKAAAHMNIQSAFDWKGALKTGAGVAGGLLPGKAGQVASVAGGLLEAKGYNNELADIADSLKAANQKLDLLLKG